MIENISRWSEHKAKHQIHATDICRSHLYGGKLTIYASNRIDKIGFITGYVTFVQVDGNFSFHPTARTRSSQFQRLDLQDLPQGLEIVCDPDCSIRYVFEGV